jgi:uncharacterized protein YbjT (DUF2867 family)
LAVRKPRPLSHRLYWPPATVPLALATTRRSPIKEDGMTYLVTAATGNIGSAVVGALLERDERVRAVSRSEMEWPAGVEGVVGDLDDPDGLRDAAAGVRGVFLMSGYSSEAGLLDALPLDARVVLLSSGSVPGGSPQNAVTRYHEESEQAVKASGRSWTMLQPNSFMANALRWKPQLDAGDAVRLPFAGVPIALIDPADVGAVGAAALTDDRHAERSYRLSGPEALLPESQVAILAAGLGRRLVFEPQSDEEARRQMQTQMPDEYVDAFFAFFVDGTLDETTVWPTVEEVLGRPPGTFAAWTRRNAHRF